MATDTKVIERAIDLTEIVGSELPIERVEWEPYDDATGEPALRITIWLDDSAPDDALRSGLGIRIRDVIHDRLLASGVTDWPYVFFTSRKDREAAAKERAEANDA